MAANNISTTGAQLKNKYAPRIVNEVPVNAVLSQYRDPNAPGASGAKESLGSAVSVPISWRAATALGKKWIVPTKVKSGQGISYMGSSGAKARFNDALAMEIVEIQVDGAEMNGRTEVTYRATSTAQGGDSSYETMAQIAMKDIKDTMFNRVEIAALWGQNGIGAIESQSISGSVMTAVITQATWSTAIWAASIGAQVEFFSGTTYTPGTQGTQYAEVTSFTASTRTVVFTYNDATGLVSGSAPAAGTVAYFGGPYSHALVTGGTYNEMAGLYVQFSATSGTYFNVNRANYSLLQGQTQDAGSIPLTKATVLAAAKQCIDKGNMNDLVCLVPTGAWLDLANEDMANRVFDTSYSPQKSESGSQFLEYSNLNGKIRVVCHPFMKAGFAFVFTPGMTSWVGSSDVSFNLPNAPVEQLFLQTPDYNTWELRAYVDKCIFHDSPSQACVINNIVSTNP